MVTLRTEFLSSVRHILLPFILREEGRDDLLKFESIKSYLQATLPIKLNSFVAIFRQKCNLLTRQMVCIFKLRVSLFIRLFVNLLAH